MRAWPGLPFLKILIPFVAGIFVAIYSDFSWWFFVPILLMLTSIVYGVEFWANKKLVAIPKLSLGAAIILLFFLLGFVRVDTFRDINRPSHFSKTKATFYKIKVIDIPEVKYNNVRFRAKVESASSADSITSRTGNALVYWDTACTRLPTVGEEYWVSSKLHAIPFPKNPNEFNYKEYLSYYNIYYKTYVKSNSQFRLAQENTSWLNALIVNIRNNTLQIFKTYLKDHSTYLMAQALVLGGKNKLDVETKSHFAHTGTLHVLAVSGLHVGIIFLILGFITKGLLRLKNGKYLRVLFMLLSIWIYALVTGFSPSVQRASIMFTLLTIGKLYQAKANGINTLFASAFLMLSFNPFLIVNVGFQLSYAAVLGIMLMYKPIYNLFAFSSIKNKVLWTVVDKAWAVCAISFAAQLATFPISVFYFGQFPIYFLFSNLVVIPMVFALLCLAVSLVLLHFIPILAKGIAFLFHCIAKFVLYSVSGVAKLPFAYASGLHLEFWQVIWLYLIISLFIAFLHYQRLKFMNFSLLGIAMLLLFINVRYIRKSGVQKVVLHSVRKSQVLTFIHGNSATIIADSAFIKNTSAQKFFLAPYFRANYIKRIKLKNLEGRLVAARINEDSLLIKNYTSKYPRLPNFAQSKSQFTWLLHRNSYTDTLVSHLPSRKVIWSGTSKNGVFASTKFKGLDSFAVEL